MSATSKAELREVARQRLNMRDSLEVAAVALYRSEIPNATEADWCWADEIVRDYYRGRVITPARRRHVDVVVGSKNRVTTIVEPLAETPTEDATNAD